MIEDVHPLSDLSLSPLLARRLAFLQLVGVAELVPKFRVDQPAGLVAGNIAVFQINISHAAFLNGG